MAKRKSFTLDDLAIKMDMGFKGVEEKITKETDIKIEKLAVMVNKGFEHLDKKIDDFRIDINQRLDHIEQVILDDHRERINRLEDQVKELQADFRALVGKK